VAQLLDADGRVISEDNVYGYPFEGGKGKPADCGCGKEEEPQPLRFKAMLNDVAAGACLRILKRGTVKGQPASPERMLRIEMAEPFQAGFRVQFSGIGDRDEAERWRDRYLLAPRAELPEPDENEIYLHDLVGLNVERNGGEIIGQVVAYYELRHDVMVEVQRAEDTVMIPYRFVTEVDLEQKRLVVELPDGLL
jgi:16S rRNA processing protein RimM